MKKRILFFSVLISVILLAVQFVLLKKQSAKKTFNLSKTIITQEVLAQTTDGSSAEGTIHNLGFGPSNGARIEAMIEKIRPDSPYLGYGDEIVAKAKEFNLDPLMIIITIKESQLCADNGANVPGGSDPDNFNCGNITWEAAQFGADVSSWNATQGAYVDERYFTFVPTMEDGLGLFFDYIDNPLYQGKTLGQFYDVYNPCSDRVNQEKGYACGAKEADDMLQLLSQYAGEPCSGADCAIGTSPEGKTFGAIPPLTLVVRPNTPNSYVINQATATVLGGNKIKSPKPSGPCEIGSPDEPKWEKINEYDQYFAAAAEEFGFDGNILKAMAMIESDGQGHYAPDGSILTGCDQYGGGCAKGIMQVKPEIWYDPEGSIGRQIGADPLIPEGNIRLAAKLMSDWTRETGTWENAITQKYHPGTGQYGLTQDGYIDLVNDHLEELDAASKSCQ